METRIDLTPETKLRFNFFTAKTIRGRILIKRSARAAGYEALARELEAAGYVPVNNADEHAIPNQT